MRVGKILDSVSLHCIQDQYLLMDRCRSPLKTCGGVKTFCVGIGRFPWVWCRLLCPEHQFHGIFYL